MAEALIEDEGGASASTSANVVGTGKIASRDFPMTKVKRRPAITEAALSPYVLRLFEALEVPNAKGGMGIMRHKMPQLKDYDAFAQDLKDNGHSVTLVSANPRRLTPTQGNFNEKKVEGMAASGNWKNSPIITSRDDYVIDGHHRWLAAVKLAESIMCRRVHMNADDLLEFCDGKPYVLNHGINESTNNVPA